MVPFALRDSSISYSIIPSEGIINNPAIMGQSMNLGLSLSFSAVLRDTRMSLLRCLRLVYILRKFILGISLIEAEDVASLHRGCATTTFYFQSVSRAHYFST